MYENDGLSAHLGIVSVEGYRAPVTDLADFARLAAEAGGLAVVVTTRADTTAQASLVSAGVADNPLTGRASAAFVVHGSAHKLVNIRRRPHTTVVASHGYEWATVEGPATIIGLDDPQPGFDEDAIRVLLRTVFTAAGGTHDNWDEYDRVMRADRRAAVFVEPERVYSNG
jgi:PPOX class probable F420-dependent enzyme